MIRLAFLTLGLAMGLNSCQPNSLEENELRAYLANPDNGLYKNCEIGDLAISVCYQPADLLGVLHQAPSKNSPEFTPLPPSQYFLLSLSRNKQEALDPSRGFSSFSNLLQTLAFRPQEYMTLVTASGDTLLPSNAELERTYGMSSSTRLLVAFPPLAQTQNLMLRLREFGLNTGDLHFNFTRQDLLALPQLKSSTVKNTAEIQ